MINPLVLPVTMNEQLSKAVQDALSPEEIRAAIVAEAEKQAADKQNTDAATADAAQKTADEAAAVVAAQGFKRNVTIGGKEFEFEAPTELELERSINNALTVAFSLQSAPVVEKTEVVVPEKQPTEEEKAAAAAELELKFKRGEITAADYLEQSGAVSDYLSKKGVSIDSLKAIVESSQSSKFEQSWATAAEEFRTSAAGADWPGGERNKRQIGMQIAALGLVDAEDKVAAFAQAFTAMKQQGLVFPGEAEETAAAAAKVETVTIPKTTAVVTTSSTGGATISTTKKEITSSSLFGASSGVGATVVAGKDGGGQKFDIPANATPAEILDAWKKAQVAAGVDPNAAFTSTFASRRA